MDGDHDETFRHRKRLLHARLQPAGIQLAVRTLLQQDAVDHCLHGVVFALFQPHPLGNLDHLAVHTCPKPLLVQGLQLLAKLSLTPPHQRCQHGDALTRRQGNHALHNLIGALSRNFVPTLGAMRAADAGPKQAQVIVDLRDGAHGRSGRPRCRLLLDGDGRRKAVNRVHIGPLHLVQKLPCVRRQGLHVASLPLGVDGVEGKGTFARTGQASHHGE